MRKPSRELRDLYETYIKKSLRPQKAVEFASNFTTDLGKNFGEVRNAETPLRPDYRELVPTQFLSQLNQLLDKHKQSGFNSLDNTEKMILQDTHVMLGALIRSSVRTGPHETVDGEERYQIPNTVAEDLEYLSEHGA